MLDIKFIRDNVEKVKLNIEQRRMSVDIDALLILDEKKRACIHEIETLRSEQKKSSKGKPSPEDIEKLKGMSDAIKAKEEEFSVINVEFEALHKQVPNMAHPDSPIGDEKDFVTLEEHNVVEHTQTRTHDDIMIEKDLIDFERGAKVVGSKFYFLKNDAVRLEFALLQYGLDILTKHGFELVMTPDMARNDVLEGTGYNPRGEEDQIYTIENTDLSLVGTAEVTMGGYHMDEVLDLSTGPKKYAAISHCFRKESGSYGRTSKGLYRVHQFTKLEMFVYCKPEESEQLHQDILAIEEEICNGLGLQFRIIDIPTGDLGAPAYRKYDIEAWMTMIGENGGYGEITSASNCTDYQARRLNIRYKDENGDNQFVHTLNGTAVVMSRFPVAIIEQFQQENGSIAIPNVLQTYMNGKTEIS